MKEVRLGRLAGPFLFKPFENLLVSPVGLIPKKDGTWRLIHHLSFPPGHSVNDHIDNIHCTVKYTSFDEALEMITEVGTGAVIARLDIKSAFRLIPIHPSDFSLLGYKIAQYYFVDKCLPFGCAISCALFEKFANFLEWELKRRAKSDSVVHYLDDFLIAGSDFDKCVTFMNCYRSLCSDLGVPLAEEKTLGPATRINFLGLEIDTLEMMVRIPADKLDKLRQQLVKMLGCKKTTLLDLQSLTGLLNFCSKAIPSARAFIRRFYNAMQGMTNPHHHVRISAEMREDIKMLLFFLDQFNGTYLFNELKWVDSDDLELYTDSAGGINLGCAAIFGTHWVFFKWPSKWKNCPIMRDITFLELVPIFLAFLIWSNEFKYKRIVLHTDNKGLIPILNRKTSKSKRVMGLVRPLVLCSMLCGIYFKAIHIEGKSNIVADALSRQQMDRFRMSLPNADESPAPIPESFLQTLSKIE
ncbi:hypothetical protein FSP39_024643 [Pinctada imbricata]|uniref:Reverse transcriptase domain-containing protein n=1 Tax=Pinctada imbricata TaxID=66713 RepID=A0AA89C117_PINIB|nr:hypothetical protein FSP39_024643 [Pinctada imbricata]